MDRQVNQKYYMCNDRISGECGSGSGSEGVTMSDQNGLNLLKTESYFFMEFLLVRIEKPNG